MKFELNSDGFDGLLDDLKTFEIDCPECDHPIEVSLDNIGSIVKCPQCGADIKLESEQFFFQLSKLFCSFAELFHFFL